MKIDRYKLPPAKTLSKRAQIRSAHGISRVKLIVTLALLAICAVIVIQSQQEGRLPGRQLVANQSQTMNVRQARAIKSQADSISVKTANVRRTQSQPEAIRQLRQVIYRLANGQAFDAKVRQRVWTAGRETVAVGTYEQAGNASGWFNLQMTMHDGDGKHTSQQISDGRLAWTRLTISDRVVLRRVDVGRLNEWIRQSERPQQSEQYVSPRLRVGAWTEILDAIERDYVLQLAVGHARKGNSNLPSSPLLIISGSLSDAARNRIKQQSRVKSLPELFPTNVKIAVATEANPETGFGKGLPVRLEYWSDPVENASSSEATARLGRLVSLTEIYSIRPIKRPPIERFRFEHHDPSVNIVNETDRYLQRYNIRLTDTQRKQMRR